ncbi:hypothetical protein CAJAP_01736 [Camponotus japonicus]
MEQIENQDVSEGELSLVCKKRTRSKRNVSVKMGNLSLACRAEAMQQQMTTNVKASCDEIITESSKADYIPVNIPQPKNFATLFVKNPKKIKYVRKKLKQSKNEEEIEKKNKKILKNIEATQQQMTTNVKADGAEMIDDSNEEVYIHGPIFIQAHENFATLSEKNVKEIKDGRKKLEQNKNKEKKEKKSKKKLKNIGAAQQQMTTVKMSHNEIITKPKADYIRVPVYTPQSENFATLSEKNVKEIKDVRKKLEQNKNEEKKEKKSKKKLKNIGAAQQQMTRTVKMSHNEIITKPKANYIRVPIYIPQSQNFATLSEKNVKEIKDVRKKLEQNKNEEKKEKKSKKKLKNIGAAQQQMTRTVKMSHNEIITKPKANYIRVPIYIPQSQNFATLSEKNVKEIKDVRKKLEQNKNEEKKEKKSKKKLKNIGAAQQQRTTTVKMSHNEIITKSKTDYIRVPVYTPQSENFATLSEKNDKNIKYVPEKFKQNKEELKYAEVTQEQITTNTKTADVEMTLVPSKIDDEKCELMKQDAHLHTNRENQQYVIEKMKQKMIENDVPSHLENTSKVSEVVKVSRKNYITLPSVTLQMTRMKEEDYYHITPRPTNIAEKSDKSVELLKEAKEFNKDSLINLMEDFDSIKDMINKAIIKMLELLEDLKMNNL